MKKFATLLAIVMVAVFSAGVIVAADAPEKATIKDVQKSKAPVTFNHKAHAAQIGKCAECHHSDAAGKEQKCFACHKAEKAGNTPDLKTAMHDKCKGCHQKGGKGPTKCDDCHKK